MSDKKFKVGDLVKVSHASKQIYRISWIAENGLDCQIQAKKENDKGWYSAQNFDTSCLFEV